MGKSHAWHCHDLIQGTGRAWDLHQVSEGFIAPIKRQYLPRDLPRTSVGAHDPNPGMH